MCVYVCVKIHLGLDMYVHVCMCILCICVVVVIVQYDMIYTGDRYYDNPTHKKAFEKQFAEAVKGYPISLKVRFCTLIRITEYHSLLCCDLCFERYFCCKHMMIMFSIIMMC